MKKNIGIADKLIRLIVSAAILVLFLTNIISGTLAIILLIVAGIFVVTSFINFCPLYLPFGLNTCRKSEE